MLASGRFGGEREVRTLGRRRGLGCDGRALAQRRAKRRRFSRKDARGPYWGTYRNDTALVRGLTSIPLSAHLLGGFVSESLVRSTPGLSGAASAMLFALVAAVRILVGILSTVLNPDPDAVSFSEHAGLLFATISTFICCFALSVFAG
jgi:hypothetical protein